MNVPTTFLNFMNSCFHDMLDQLITIYLDNLLIYSGIKLDYEVYLFWVFDYLHEETFFNKCKKYEFRKDSVEYFSCIVRQAYVSMEPSKIQEITE